MAALKEIKRVENAILYTDGTNEYIKLENVRGSFLKIGHPEPEEDDDGNPRLDQKGKQKMRYSGAFMLNKKTHVAAKDLCVEVMNRLLKANDAKVAADKKFIKNGDEETREEYEGHWIVNAGESRAPSARTRQGDVLRDADEIDDTFYSGCYLNVMIRPWFFNGKAKGAKKDYPKRVSAGLTGVQFVRDGESFGASRVNDDDAWGSVEGEDRDEDLDGDDEL